MRRTNLFAVTMAAGALVGSTFSVAIAQSTETASAPTSANVSTTSTADLTPIGRITAAFGVASIQDVNGVKSGDLHALIKNDDRIATDGGGVSVLLASRVVLKLDAKSCVSVRESAGRTDLVLEYGSVQVFVGKRPAEYGPVTLQDAQTRIDAANGVFLASYNPERRNGYYACEHSVVQLTTAEDEKPVMLHADEQAVVDAGKMSSNGTLDRLVFAERKQSLDRLGQSAVTQGTQTFRLRSRAFDTEVALSQLSAAGWIDRQAIVAARTGKTTNGSKKNNANTDSSSGSNSSDETTNGTETENTTLATSGSTVAQKPGAGTGTGTAQSGATGSSGAGGSNPVVTPSGAVATTATPAISLDPTPVSTPVVESRPSPTAATPAASSGALTLTPPKVGVTNTDSSSSIVPTKSDLGLTGTVASSGADSVVSMPTHDAVGNSGNHSNNNSTGGASSAANDVVATGGVKPVKGGGISLPKIDLDLGNNGGASSGADSIDVAGNHSGGINTKGGGATSVAGANSGAGGNSSPSKGAIGNLPKNIDLGNISKGTNSTVATPEVGVSAAASAAAPSGGSSGGSNTAGQTRGLSVPKIDLDLPSNNSSGGGSGPSITGLNIGGNNAPTRGTGMPKNDASSGVLGIPKNQAAGGGIPKADIGLDNKGGISGATATAPGGNTSVPKIDFGDAKDVSTSKGDLAGGVKIDLPTKIDLDPGRGSSGADTAIPRVTPTASNSGVDATSGADGAGTKDATAGIELPGSGDGGAMNLPTPGDLGLDTKVSTDDAKSAATDAINSSGEARKKLTRAERAALRESRQAARAEKAASEAAAKAAVDAAAKSAVDAAAKAAATEAANASSGSNSGSGRGGN